MHIQEAVRTQEAERSAGALAKGSDIWGSSGGSSAKNGTSTDASSGSGITPPPQTLTQRGFMILVKLIEELQFEKELQQEKGVGLVPGPVCVV